MNITADTKIATDYIKRLRNEGAKAYQNRTESTPTAGIFKKSYEPWVADGGLERAGHISYFEETDMAYKCRVDSYRMAQYAPNIAVNNYAPLPEPDEYGIYPYVYNMDSEIGMLIRDTDNKVYECYANPVTAMIWSPSQLPASFRLIEEGF